MAKNYVYDDQAWGDDTPIAGETLSVNAHYTGHYNGKPLQITGEDTQAWDRERNSARFGTIMQSTDSNLPVESEVGS